MIDKYTNGTRKLSIEYPVISQIGSMEGSIRWVEATNYLIMNPDTGDIEDISSVTEITKQKKNEKILDLIASKGCDFVGLVDVVRASVEILNGVWNIKDIENPADIEFDAARKKLSDLYVAPEDRNEFIAQTMLDNIEKRLEKEEEFPDPL